MTTSANASTFCDACIASYFWDSLYWDDLGGDMQEKIKSGTNPEQCVDCRERCEDICDVVDEECVTCNEDGFKLETLNVKKGW